MLIALGFSANAAMYIVGNNPFGDWHTYAGVEMTDNGDGTYTYVTDQINGTVWFVFADALTEGTTDDWGTFNGSHRYGPLSSGQTITAGVEYTTQKSTTGNVSYNFTGTAGEPYQFTFNTNTMKFKVEGYVEPITEFTYTVAGNSADIFGTEWAPGETANDMTLDATDGLYKLVKNGVEIAAGYTLEYKVVENHSWGTNWGVTPNGANQTYDFNEAGTYNLTFMFDHENEIVSLDAQKVQDGPVVDPITGDFYILGQVNGNGWNPSTGIEMATTDEDIYTLTDATFTDSGDGYAYFSFTSKLGANADDWSFASYRRGAVEDGTLVEDGVNAELADWGSGNNAFKVLPGTYDVEVGLSSDYVVLTKKADPQPVIDVVYIFGDVNDYAWDPTQGVKMTYNEGIYTAEVNATARENQEKAYIGFTKKLADAESETPWDDIAAYRFGPITDGDFVMTEELLGVACDLATDGSHESIALPEGTWTVTVDLVTKKFTIDGTWPTDTVVPEPTADVYVFGDVNDYAWDPTQGVKMTFNEGIYTAEVNATARENQEKAYIGFTKKLADAESETPWDDIAAYRFGPVSDDAFVMTEELLGVACDLATDGSYNSIALPDGTWTVTVDLENNKFTVDGTWPTDTVVPEPITVYTVVGPEAIFGTNWDATDANNDMTLEEGVYTWTKEGVELTDNFGFKVVGNHDYAVYEWPMGYENDWIAYVEEPGIYTIEITFDPEAADSARIACVLTKTGEIEPEHYTGDVYILGEVNDNGGWFTNKGVLMTRDAENNLYTATITTAGENVPEGEETGYSYFSFTKQLADSAADWEAIAPYRFGAVSDGDFLVTEELLGQKLSLEMSGDAYKIPAGEWDLTLSVDDMTLIINKHGMRGDVNDDTVVNITDAINLINAILSGNFSSIDTKNADVTNDGNVNITDAIQLINYISTGHWYDEN